MTQRGYVDKRATVPAPRIELTPDERRRVEDVCAPLRWLKARLNYALHAIDEGQRLGPHVWQEVHETSAMAAVLKRKYEVRR